MRGYRDLADELRQRINGGEFRPGETLPRIVDLIDEYGLSRQTVRDAIGVLADEGLVVTMGKGGTIVRSRTRVRISLARYHRALQPGNPKGPWETACAEQGLDGQMKVVRVAREHGPLDVATLLGVPADTQLLYRRRHATIGTDDVVQVQQAWYPAHLADEAGLTADGKIVGGIYSALTAAGYPPTTASEQVDSRMPTASEAAQLKIGGKVPVLAVQRLTKGPDGRVLELLRATAAADRIQLAYDDLPLTADRTP
ncbi:GntR family transcriptional regulator [Streptomyces alkaliterrae]|uniref:GntR family transcriptional regulator n=1 Tax=Streptomyces alkaliterrae TaxID=2213162 RepID=A0A5P0YLE1_9ACTN|nr:GntR family transcriptional regulator [Streptomyces alkaliterrae]MBB1258306.1 GntR family transcriptional regulator [Streptomyces alkaliterrae]MQS00710.1 UTRA domain-containing protein [Streptomyces alkaliterrae]